MSARSAEARYRRLLRWFPEPWRRYREEEVLAVLLEGASEEGRTRPTAAERWDLARHGLAARVDALASVRARRRTATLAAVSGAALSLGCLVLGELLPWVGPSVWPGQPSTPVAATAPGFGVVLFGLWLLALVLMVTWQARVARLLLVAVALLAWSAPDWGVLLSVSIPPLYLCVVLGVLALLAATADVSPRFGRTLRDGRVGASVVLVGSALVAAAARPGVMWQTGDPRYAFYRQWPVGVVGVGRALLWVLPVALLGLVLLAFGWRAARPWVGPAVVVAVPWAELALLAGGGSTARAGFPAAVALALVAGAVIFGHLAGVRVGVRRVRPGTSVPDAEA